VQACFFNNLIESLLAHSFDRPKIVQYGHGLQALVEPLNPTLVYLVQEDVDRALEWNFKGRGKGFRNHVIRYATDKPERLGRLSGNGDVLAGVCGRDGRKS
jgi:hypothetical protein